MFLMIVMICHQFKDDLLSLGKVAQGGTAWKGQTACTATMHVAPYPHFPITDVTSFAFSSMFLLCSRALSEMRDPKLDTCPQVVLLSILKNNTGGENCNCRTIFNKYC